MREACGGGKDGIIPGFRVLVGGGPGLGEDLRSGGVESRSMLGSREGERGGGGDSRDGLDINEGDRGGGGDSRDGFDTRDSRFIDVSGAASIRDRRFGCDEVAPRDGLLVESREGVGDRVSTELAMVELLDGLALSNGSDVVVSASRD
jgi:hypothetical protein